MSRWLMTLALALVAISWSANADAYHQFGKNSKFRKSAVEGGGQGNYFTGSPRSGGYDCSVCHTDAAGKVSVRLDGALISDGRWVEGRKYDFQVELLGEHLGRNNLAVLELTTDDGERLGAYPVDQVLAVVPKSGQIKSFSFTAPAAGAGRISLYLAVVHGDEAAGAKDEEIDSDPWGDDVYVARWRFCEGEQACDRSFEPLEQDEPMSPASHGCTLVAAPNQWGSAALFALAMTMMMLARSQGRLRQPI